MRQGVEGATRTFRCGSTEVLADADEQGVVLVEQTDVRFEVVFEQGLIVETVLRVGEGRPHIVDRMINGDVDWIINTPLGGESKLDERAIRRTALERGLPTMTTLAAAKAAVMAIRAMSQDPAHVVSLQEYHRGAAMSR